MPLRQRTACLLALLAALGGPAAAHAGLPVAHDRTAVRDVSGDGLVAPGDTVEIREELRNTGTSTLAPFTGTLSAVSPGAVVTQATSTWTGLPTGLAQAGTPPFEAVVPAGVACGERVPFALQLEAGDETATLGVDVGTGVAGPAVRFHGAAGAIPDDGTLRAPLTVEEAGVVKGVRVRVRIAHDDVGDLELAVVAPDGSEVLLAARRGAGGTAYADTTFATGAPAIAGAAPPFAGTYAPEGDLRRLDGHDLQGTWRLRVTDSVGNSTGELEAWSVELRPATCAPQPVAALSATPAVGVPGEPVVLDASESTTPEGRTITAYAWDRDGDGAYEQATGAIPTTSATFATRGVQRVAVRVTDSQGDHDDEELLLPVTHLPVARLALPATPPLTGEDVVLDASASTADTGGRIVAWAWDLDGDGGFETSAAGPKRTVRFPRPGTREVGLRVTDDLGASGVAKAALTVRNRPPVAALAVPAFAVEGEPARLDASGSQDPDGTVTGFAWDLDGLPGCEVAASAAPRRDITLAADREVGVCIHDDFTADPGRATARALVRVTDRPVARIAAPAVVRPRAAAALDASGSTDADGIEAYAWDLDADGAFDDATGATATAGWPAEGERVVRVRATDARGVAGVAQATVRVHNARPVAVLAVAPNPVTAGAPVSFDASGSSDPDGAVASFRFDLDGDGGYETAGGPVVSRAYPNPGTFSVGVRVADDDGGTTDRRVDLVVQPAPPGGGGGGGSGGGDTGGGGGTGGGDGGGTGGGGGGAGGGATGGGGPSGDGAPPRGGAAGGGDGGGAVGAAQGAPAVVLRARTVQRLAAVRRRGLRLSATADRPVTLRLTAWVPRATARRLGLARRPRRAVAVGRVRGPAGALVLRLSRAARTRFGQARTVLVTVRGTATDATGRSVAVARTVTVRR